MKKLAAFLFVVALLCCAAAAWIYLGVRRPFRGYSAPEQFVDDPLGAGRSERRVGTA
jgi:hypothetical protein